MAKSEAVFVYIGTYPNEAAAQADYAVAKDLHALRAVGSYDAAVVTKCDNGKVHQNKELGDLNRRRAGRAGDRRREHDRAGGGQAALKAEKQGARELNVKPKDIDKAIEEAPGEVS